MTHIKNILPVLICLHLFGILYGQGRKGTYDPISDINLTQTAGDEFNQVGLLGDVISFTPDGYQIFEAGSNQNLDNRSGLDTGDKPWKYVVFPKMNISNIREPVETAIGTLLSITIAATYPEQEEVAIFLQNSTEDAMVERSDIHYLTIHGYVLYEDIGGLVTKSRSRMVLRNGNALNVVLQYSDLSTANEAYSSLITGVGSLEIALLINQRHLRAGCDFMITSDDIMESTAYRDFVSPILGDTISVDQATQITGEILQEVASKYQCRGNAPESLKTLASDVFNALFSQRQVWSFEQLTANNYLVDFEGHRYRASEFKSFLQSNLSEDIERDSQSSSNQSRFVYDKQKKTLIDTKAKGGLLFGLVKGDGAVKTDVDRSLKRDQSQKSSTSRSSEEMHKSNVILEFDGSYIIPKGIVTHEVIDVNADFRQRFSGSFHEHIQAFETKSVQISYHE